MWGAWALRFFSLTFVVVVGLGSSGALAQPDILPLTDETAVGSQSRWEVALLFLTPEGDADYQGDIDRNILELARLEPNSKLSVNIYREFIDRDVEYKPDPTSPILSNIEGLFQVSPLPGLLAPGPVKTNMVPHGPTILSDPERLKQFFERSFTKAGSRRILVIYAHGLGPKGLRILKLKTLNENLKLALGSSEGRTFPLDLLWLDSCLMANLEASYQLRTLSPLLAASENTEFSAGSPFDVLQILSEKEYWPLAAAKALAARYVESYSFLESGRQRRAVLKSAATISVIDTQKLQPVVSEMPAVKAVFKGLSEATRARLQRQTSRALMEAENLVDLGAFTRFLWDATRAKGVPGDSRLNEIMTMVDARTKRAKRTNPRIKLSPPVRGQIVVYGYNQWTRGFQGDDEVLSKAPVNMKPEGYVLGPFGKMWPYRHINVRIYVSPFAPDLNEFGYYFISDLDHPDSAQVVSMEKRPDSDYYLSESENPKAPVVFNGYTQGIGASAELFSGLSVLNPFSDLPNLDYIRLDFFLQTKWTQ